MSWKSIIGISGSVYNRTALQLVLRSVDQIHISNQGILKEIPVLQSHQNKITKIPMGVDTDWFNSNKIKGSSLSRSSDYRRILYVGSFRRYKGLEELVSAFANIRESQKCCLTLVGDGPLRSKVQERVNMLNISDDVEFVGQLSDEELRKVYASADVFVLPSPTIKESFGLVAIEAMAMGIPTVVTSGSGIGYVLEDYDAGIVVEPNNIQQLSAAVEALLNDTTHREEQSKAGRTLVTNKFAWDKLVSDYRTAYTNLSD